MNIVLLILIISLLYNNSNSEIISQHDQNNKQNNELNNLDINHKVIVINQNNLKIEQQQFRQQDLKEHESLIKEDDDNINNKSHLDNIRTATGGFIYTLMVILTVFAFLSNGAFLIYVFWLSK